MGIEISKLLNATTENKADLGELLGNKKTETLKVVKDNKVLSYVSQKSEEQAYVATDLDDTDISDDLDLNGDGKITLDEISRYMKGERKEDKKTEEPEAKTESETKTDKGGEAGRSEDGTVNISKMLEMTEEEIAEMSPEELVELYKDASNAFLTAHYTDKDPYGSDEVKKLMELPNAVGLNKLLMTMVSKMSDEQLEAFLETYKEKYPTTQTGDHEIMFGSYEDIARNIMWTNYTVFAKVADKDEVYEYLQRMKKFFPQLIPDVDGGVGIKQWA